MKLKIILINLLVISLVGLFFLYSVHGLEGFVDSTDTPTTIKSTQSINPDEDVIQPVQNECEQNGWNCKSSCDRETEYGGYGRLGCPLLQECCKPKVQNSENTINSDGGITAANPSVEKGLRLIKTIELKGNLPDTIPFEPKKVTPPSIIKVGFIEIEPIDHGEAELSFEALNPKFKLFKEIFEENTNGKTIIDPDFIILPKKSVNFRLVEDDFDYLDNQRVNNNLYALVDKEIRDIQNDYNLDFLFLIIDGNDKYVPSAAAVYLGRSNNDKTFGIIVLKKGSIAFTGRYDKFPFDMAHEIMHDKVFGSLKDYYGSQTENNIGSMEFPFVRDMAIENLMAGGAGLLFGAHRAYLGYKEYEIVNVQKGEWKEITIQNSCIPESKIKKIPLGFVLGPSNEILAKSLIIELRGWHSCRADEMLVGPYIPGVKVHLIFESAFGLEYAVQIPGKYNYYTKTLDYTSDSPSFALRDRYLELYSRPGNRPGTLQSYDGDIYSLEVLDEYHTSSGHIDDNKYHKYLAQNNINDLNDYPPGRYVREHPEEGSGYLEWSKIKIKINEDIKEIKAPDIKFNLYADDENRYYIYTLEQSGAQLIKPVLRLNNEIAYSSDYSSELKQFTVTCFMFDNNDFVDCSRYGQKILGDDGVSALILPQNKNSCSLNFEISNGINSEIFKIDNEINPICKSDKPESKCTKCPDVNTDGIIDIKDLSTVAKHIKETNSEYNIETSNDVVDENDLRCVSKNFGQDSTKINECNNADRTTIGDIVVYLNRKPADLSKEYLAGQYFEIRAYLASGRLENVKEAKAEVLLNNKLISSIGLGCFLDIDNNKNRCSGKWNTANIPPGSNTFSIRITLTDDSGEETTASRDFTIKFHEILPELCKEVIPGHNNPDSDRANVVFIGFGYDDYVNLEPEEALKDIAEYVVDFEGDNNGLFYFEPFKSNKDKFNFWYVDKLSPLNYCDLPDDWSFVTCKDDDFLAFNCVYNN